MTYDPETIQSANSGRTRKRLPSIILGALSFFVILEPVWMLLPFAGFLYGSVMHIEALSGNPYTARLVHFVFPTHTLFPLGLLLILTGLLIFLTGAIQIYAGKISKRGLIKTGIYRRFRHPQYLALAIFGLGIILTWGRLITFIAYFVMLWLYYLLAGSEEKHCRQLFGAEYDAYRADTHLLFFGEELLYPQGISFVRADKLLNSALFAPFRTLAANGLPPWSRIAISFPLVLVMATAAGLMIIELRAEFRNSVPAMAGAYPLAGPSPAVIPLLLIKGPALQAAPIEKIRNRFMAQSLEMVLSSGKIRKTVGQLDPDRNSTLLVFPTPGRNWYGNTHRENRRAAVDVIIFCVNSPIPYRGDNFREFRRNWRISHLIKVEDLSPERLRTGLDPAGGGITTKRFQPRMEERIDFFLSGL
jgi:protein-S-isoprenylcysteine O-methyltransferase Ste14